MATNYYATYKRFNGTDWDVFYFTTVASQVAETTTRKWLSADQQTWLNAYLDPVTFNLAGGLVRADPLTGFIPVDVIPGGLDYLPLAGGIMAGNIDMNGNNITKLGSLAGNAAADLVFGVGADTYMSFKYNATAANRYIQMQYAIDMNNTKLSGLANATNSQDAATWGQVQSMAADGLKPMPPVVAATLVNITPSGLQSVDDVILVEGDRVLVKAQSTASQNGIYTASSGTWTKINAQSLKGFYGQVLNGTENRGTWWYASTDTSWLLHSVPDEYGTVTNGGLELVGMNFGIKTGGVTNEMLAGSINSEKLLGIPVEKLNVFSSADDMTIVAATTSQVLADHLKNLYSMVKSVKGTINAHTAQSDTITSLKTLVDTKNRSYKGTTNPDTVGYVVGDLYFQHNVV